MIDGLKFEIVKKKSSLSTRITHPETTLRDTVGTWNQRQERRFPESRILPTPTILFVRYTGICWIILSASQKLLTTYLNLSCALSWINSVLALEELINGNSIVSMMRSGHQREAVYDFNAALS